MTRSTAVWSPAGTDRSSDQDHREDGSDQNIGLLATEPAAVNFQQIDWLDEHHHAVSAMLMQRGFVPLYPQLVKASGSVKAALMLGQAIGLSRTWLKREPARNGWFWMGSADWQAATGLTPREQESAREALVDTGLWEERRTHNPSRLYFRVHLHAVAIALGLGNPASEKPDDVETPSDKWAWNDSVATNVLGESQMFFKPLADLAGGVMPGLLLSQLLARQRVALRERRIDAQGQFQISYDELADGLLLGAKVVRNARTQLRQAGFVSEQVRGSGPSARVHVGVNLAAMMACLQAQPTTAMNQRVAAARLMKPQADRQRPIAPSTVIVTGPNPPLTIAGFRQSSDETAAAQLSLIEDTPTQNQGHAGVLQIQDGSRVNPDGALLSVAKRATTPSVDNVAALLSVAEPSRCPFVGSDGAVLSVAYTEIKYREPPPTYAHATPVDNFEPGRRRIFEQEPEPKSASSLELSPATDLIVPDGVSHAQALRVVEAAPAAMRQLLLDELAGHMQSKRKSVDSPLGFLHTIARKAINGTLVTTKADEVALARRARADAAARLAQSPPQAATAGGPALAPSTAPADPAQHEAVRAKLRAVRNQIVAKAVLAPMAALTAGGTHDE